MNDDQKMCLDWEDEIQDDGQEFVILPEGDYDFRVSAMERGRSKGTGKIPACNMAALTLTVDDGHGRKASCKTNILLYKTLEWKISQFFRSIGQKGEGEKVKMDWNNVIGATGRAHFKPRKYTGKDGSEKEANDVAYFIASEDAHPAKPAAPAPSTTGGFTEVEDEDAELPF